MTLFIRHTSASLTIQENADPSVLDDLMTALDRLAPEDAGWTHDAEGPDDMPAHVKTMLTATSLQIPVLNASWRSEPGRRSIWSSIAAVRIGARSCCNFSAPLDDPNTKAGRRAIRGRRIAPRPACRARVDDQVLVMSTSLVSGRKSKPMTRLIDRDADRIPQAGIDVSGSRRDGEHGRGQEAAEPAIADMIGQ